MAWTTVAETKLSATRPYLPVESSFQFDFNVMSLSAAWMYIIRFSWSTRILAILLMLMSKPSVADAVRVLCPHPTMASGKPCERANWGRNW